MPFFEATFKTLQMARDQMVSGTKNPTANIMVFLGNRIDEIFDSWREQGMIPPDTRPTSESSASPDTEE